MGASTSCDHINCYQPKNPVGVCNGGGGGEEGGDHYGEVCKSGQIILLLLSRIATGLGVLNYCTNAATVLW